MNTLSSQAFHADWEGFQLTPEGAVWDPCSATLWIADVHLGKGATYRQLGMPVPAGTTSVNLQRLHELLTRTDPQHLVILGDLVHSRRGLSAALNERVLAWRSLHARVRMTLVEGNHDASAGALPVDWNIATVLDPTLIAGVVCCHRPPIATAIDGGLCFAGHLHPSVALHGPGRDRVRVPCFFARGRTLLLPAFGAFTGGADIRDIGLGRPTALFALAEQHVVPIGL
jgi:uncharacterized protein